ncbi:MAG: putative GH25 family protein [Enterobacterales bacterium]|jgi:uncharacterized GH25 family protein
MIKKITLLVPSSIVLLLIFQTVSAHDYWLAPSTYAIPKGDILTARLLVGDRLSPELSRDLNKERTKSFSLLNADGKFDLLKEFSQGALPIFSRKMNVEGQNLISIEREFYRTEMTDNQFSSFLEHENMTDIMALRKKLGHKDIDHKRYARSIKSLVKVGAQLEGDLHRELLGHMNEIILLDNPYKLKTGDMIRVQLFDRGNALAGRTITAFNGEGDEHISTQKVVTDAKGIASFKMDKKGFWMVRSSHLWQCTQCENVGWEGYISSYSFSL